MNYCDWTERVNANGSVTWKCSNKTEEKQDEYGRAYCTEHRIKVDQINKSRHKDCINKEKLIKYFNKLPKNQKLTTKTLYVFDTIFEKIENGEFH